MYTYIYVFICIHVYVYIYVYIVFIEVFMRVNTLVLYTHILQVVLQRA